MNDNNFLRRYFVGVGVDVGGKPDPLALYQEFFPGLQSVRTWDWEDGDAQFMQSVADGEFDFLHSSHCLEHLRDPNEGIKNWLRVVKPGGYVIIMVPDEDMYEQDQFPSSFNQDHKWTFTINKSRSWSNKSLNILDLINGLGPEVEIQRLVLLNSTYRDDLPRYDQTLTPLSECGIEFVLRRRLPLEMESGRRKREAHQPSASMRAHFNQYRDDLNTLKAANRDNPPFENDAEI